MKFGMTFTLAMLGLFAFASSTFAQSGSRSPATVTPPPAIFSPGNGQSIPQPVAQTAEPAPNAVGQNYFDVGSGACQDDCYSQDCCQPCRYFRIFGGWNDTDEFDAPVTAAASGAEFGTSDGWAIGGAIGRYLNDNTRAELEFTYRTNSFDGVVGLGGPVIPISGDIQAYSIMSNLIRDLNNVSLGGFTPYIGGGLGIAFVDGETSFGGFPFTVDDTALGYQGFIGLQRALGRFTFFTEYRYFGTAEVEFTGGGNSASSEYQAQNIFFGMQFSR